MAFYHVYADESRQTKSRYMLFGALFIPRGAVEDKFLLDVKTFRQKRNLNGEFKWGKVSKSYIEEYKQLVDLFFENPLVHFSCLVIDTHKIDYANYHDGNKETGFYAFYYLALSRNMSIDNRYLVMTDQKNDCRGTNRLGELKKQINKWGREEKGAAGDIVVNVEPRDSKKVDALQVNDVLLGAVGYAIEGYDTAAHKVELVSHLETRLGCESLALHRGRGTAFNIWVFDFAKAKPSPNALEQGDNLQKQEGRPNS